MDQSSRRYLILELEEAFASTLHPDADHSSDFSQPSRKEECRTLRLGEGGGYGKNSSSNSSDFSYNHIGIVVLVNLD